MMTNRVEFFSKRVSAWGFAEALGFLVCLFTLTGFAGRYYWLLDLTSHFRLQYAVILLVLAVIFAISRKFIRAAIFGLLMLPNMLAILPFYVPPAAVSTEISSLIRAILINVNTKSGDPDRVLDFIIESRPDVFVIEEIDQNWLLRLKEVEQLYPHSITCPRDDNFGIGLFSRTPLKEPRILRIGQAEVPAIFAVVLVADRELSVLGIHALPPYGPVYSQWRDDQLAAIPDFLKNHPTPLLLLGDLNTTPWSSHFQNLLSSSGLCDSSRGRGLQLTWPTWLPPLLIPIDHCLHSADIIILDRSTGPSVGSDHLPLIIDFSL